MNPVMNELHNAGYFKDLKTICQLGTNFYEEQGLFNHMFPNAENIYLFEPVPESVAAVKEKVRDDPRVEIFPFAISNSNRTDKFYLLGPPDCSFSALTPFAEEGQRISPTIKERGVIEVQVRTLPWVIREYGLVNPDVLWIDIHGAEYDAIASLTTKILNKLKVIHCECCTVEFHKGGKTLKDVRSILDKTHDHISWYTGEPNDWTKMGDAVWLKKGWGPR